MIGALAAAYGIATLFIPFSFFTSIGYSDLHSLYQPTSSIASFQFLEGTDVRRMQSFMSGPNQFGLWLLLPAAAGLQLLLKSVRERRKLDSVLYAVLETLFFSALVLTYSRSAWIGAAVILVAFGSLRLRRCITSALHRSLVLVGVGIVAGFALVIAVNLWPDVLIRAQSFKGHFEKPIEALHTMQNHPFGLGLGTAGPASNRLSDTCVFLPLGADYSWTKAHPNLCVFLGGVRKLPAGKACECPLLTENWYLQWGVEMGYAGFLLALAITGLALWYGCIAFGDDTRLIPVLAFLGIATGGLFLHSFEDAAVAYSLWLLLAACGLRSLKTSLIQQ
jgi:O-antigen ligase